MINTAKKDKLSSLIKEEPEDNLSSGLLKEDVKSKKTMVTKQFNQLVKSKPLRIKNEIIIKLKEIGEEQGLLDLNHVILYLIYKK